MESRKSKSTRPATRRAGQKTERPATPLERAKAVITVHEQGGFTLPKAENPFFANAVGVRDVLSNVSQGLELWSQLSLTDAGIAMTKDLDFAQHLFLQTMRKALDAATEHAKHEEQVAWARGVVAASEGAK
jgi:hypothetical protein